MSKHIIELNGKRYDAVTGALLGVSEVQSVIQVAEKRAVRAAHRGRVIDGIVGPGKVSVSANTHMKIAPATVHPQLSSVQTTAVKVVKKPVAKRAGGKAITPHQPERPKTLMRTIVKKPNITMKPAIKTQAPAEVVAKPDGTLVPKLSVQAVDPGRLARAKQTARNRFVQRFDTITTTTVPTSAPVHGRQAATTRSTQYNGTVAGHSAITKPAVAPVNSPQPPTDIFEAALAHATSHQQTALKQRRQHHRLANITAGIAAFLLIGSFVTYLNLPNIEVHIASVHAGFSAEVPGYKPVGYALGSIQSHNGQVSVNFRSGDQAYTVTQQASDWNSETLLDSAVALNGGAHQTIESKGRTIYLYDNNRAAWVNGGVRYDLTGNAVLSPSDVASIASSM